MILCDSSILEAMTAGEIGISPLTDEELDRQLQPCSIDLRLGRYFRTFDVVRRYTHPNTRYGVIFDPRSDNSDEHTRLTTITDERGWVLDPGDFVLGSTIETICLSPSILGRLDGRSSLGRLGIMVHSTAGFIDPGFRGGITLELTNVGKLPVNLSVGMRIAQLSFDRLDKPCSRPYGLRGKYQYQEPAAASKIDSEYKT